MNDSQSVMTAATLLGAIGMWLMLPRGMARGRLIGAALVAVALGLFGSQLAPLGHWVPCSVFCILAAVTVLSAIGTVTCRNPMYCAIWFGMTLVGTAGLLLFTGAQFLAVATIVVYAGAILVTVLFVLMLARPEGRAPYDRRSWEAMISSATGIVMVGVLSMTVCSVLTSPEPPGLAPPEVNREAGILAEYHVAHLGAELFGRHLIAVEVAGVLLLTALVGAAVISQAGRARPGSEPETTNPNPS